MSPRGSRTGSSLPGRMGSIRRILLVLLLVLVATAGLAPSAGAATRTEAALAYNEGLVHVTWVTSRALVDVGSQGWLVDEDGALDAHIAAARKVLGEGRARASALPPFEGDASLRDAVVASLDALDGLFENEFRVVVHTLRVEPPTAADVATAEAAWGRFVEVANQADQRVADAQTAFARRYGFVVIAAEPPSDPAGAFVAPELVPAGSVLPANFHAILATGYYNRYIAGNNALVGGFGRLVEAGSDADALDRARADLLVVATAERAFAESAEDWRGDGALRAALLTAATATQRACAADLPTYIGLLKKARLSRSEADAANAALARANEGVTTTTDALHAELEAFAVRWKLPEFQAWATQVGATPGPAEPAPAAPGAAPAAP